MAVIDILPISTETPTNEEQLQTPTEVETPENAEVTTEEPSTGEAPQNASGEQPPKTENPSEELTDEQLTALLRNRGILTEDATLEALKPKTEKSEAEKIAESDEEYKTLLSEYANSISDPKVPFEKKQEDFDNIKKIASVDETEYGFAIIKQQYKDAGWSDAKIEKVMKEKHFQFTDEEIEDMELDEDEKTELKNDRDFHIAEAKRVGSQMKNIATSTLHNLQTSIEARKVESEIEKSISAELDNFASKFSKVDLTAVDSETDYFKFDNLSLEFSKEEIAEVVNKFKDPSERNKFFYKENGAENVEFIAELMLKASKVEKAYQEGLIKGGQKVSDYYKNTYLSSKNIPIRNTHAAQEQSGKVKATGDVRQIR